MLNNPNTSLRPRRYDWWQDFGSPIGMDESQVNPDSTILRLRDLRPPDRQSALMDETVPADDSRVLRPRYPREQGDAPQQPISRNGLTLLPDYAPEDSNRRPLPLPRNNPNDPTVLDSGRVLLSTDSPPPTLTASDRLLRPRPESQSDVQPEADPSRLLRDRTVQDAPVNSPNPMGADERAGNRIDQREGRIEVLQDHPNERPTKWWQRALLMGAQGLQQASELANATRDPRTGEYTMSGLQALAMGAGGAAIGAVNRKGVNRMLNERELTNLRGEQHAEQENQDRLLKRTRELAELEKTVAETGEIQGRPTASAKAQAEERKEAISRLLTMHGRAGHYNPDDPSDRASQAILATARQLGVEDQLIPYSEKDKVPVRQQLDDTVFERGDDGQWREAKGLPKERSKTLGADGLTNAQRAQRDATLGTVGRQEAGQATADAREEARIKSKNDEIDRQIAGLQGKQAVAEIAANAKLSIDPDEDEEDKHEREAAATRERAKAKAETDEKINTLRRQKEVYIPRIQPSTSSSTGGVSYAGQTFNVTPEKLAKSDPFFNGWTPASVKAFIESHGGKFAK